MFRLQRQLALLLILLLTLGAATAQGDPGDEPAPGDVINVINEGTVDPFEIQRLATPLFGSFGPPIVENSARSYRVTFLTTGLDGELTPIEAQLFVPLLPSAAELPLYVFGSGTTGLAEACAPSRESVYPEPLGHARPYLLAYAGRGFVSIIPDYLGFNDPSSYQSYFNAEAEARVMLDAVRAVDDFFSEERDRRSAERPVFLGGYSQGGHAAFAAADLLDLYAPELELTGIMGFGATTDVAKLLREGPYYAPYILLSYRQDYGENLVDPGKVLAPKWVDGLDRYAGELCVDRAQLHYPYDYAQLYNGVFAYSLLNDRLDQDFPALNRILESNQTGLSGHELPSFIVQGERDVIVWTETQTTFVQELCTRGSEVLYLVLPGVRHKHTRPAGFEESITWMNALVTGAAPPTSCPLVLEEGVLTPN